MGGRFFEHLKLIKDILQIHFKGYTPFNIFDNKESFTKHPENILKLHLSRKLSRF